MPRWRLYHVLCLGGGCIGCFKCVSEDGSNPACEDVFTFFPDSANQQAGQPVDLSTCQPVDLSTCRSVNLSTCRSINLSTCRSVNLPIYQPVNLSIYQPVNLSTCRSINLSTCRSINLSTCQSVCLIPGSTWYFFQNISFYCSTVQSTVFCLNIKHYHISLPGFLMTVYSTDYCVCAGCGV